MSADKLLFKKKSAYQVISVHEDPKTRERFICDERPDLVQGGMDIDSPDRLAFEYNQVLFVSLAYLEREPRRALFIGLGAGSLPRYFSRSFPDCVADVVEIDASVVAVAKKYFKFREGPATRVHVADGRGFIQKTRHKYDLIVLDAYQGGKIPLHLASIQFLREIKGKLKRGGALASNLLSRRTNRLFDSMVFTFSNEFPGVHIYNCKTAYNCILVGVNGSRPPRSRVIERAEKLQAGRKFEFDLPAIARRQYLGRMRIGRDVFLIKD